MSGHRDQRSKVGIVLGGSGRRHEVVATAVRTVTEPLRTTPLGARLAQLPAAPDRRLVQRPPGPPSSWPDFRAMAEARFKGTAAAA